MAVRSVAHPHIILQNAPPVVGLRERIRS